MITTALVTVPCNSVPAYNAAYGWRDFTNYKGDGFTDTAFIYDTICPGILIYNGYGFSITEGAGVYYDTLQSLNGCDSIVCLTLTENPQIPITNYFGTICQGSIYTDNNFINLTQTGIYYDTLQNVNGCDSIIELILNYYPNVALTQYAASICEGDIYTDDNFINLTQTGIYYDTLQNINGCDSIIELILLN